MPWIGTLEDRKLADLYICAPATTLSRVSLYWCGIAYASPGNVLRTSSSARSSLRNYSSVGLSRLGLKDEKDG